MFQENYSYYCISKRLHPCQTDHRLLHHPLHTVKGINICPVTSHIVEQKDIGLEWDRFDQSIWYEMCNEEAEDFNAPHNDLQPETPTKKIKENNDVNIYCFSSWNQSYSLNHMNSQLTAQKTNPQERWTKKVHFVHEVVSGEPILNSWPCELAPSRKLQ